MSFLRRIFRRERRDTVALIDIGARRVAGAYVHYVGSETPVVVYTKVMSIPIQTGEEHSVTMLRTLGELCDAMVAEGVPALVRAIGGHAVDAALVSIDAPWQETAVHHERVLKDSEFVYTKQMVAEAVARVSPPAAGKIYSDASVVGTRLNGYEVRNPYGRRAHRATTIILTSLIEEKVSSAILATVQKLSQTERVSLIAGTSLRYQALHVAFAHERDALILDATGPLPEVALVRKGLLAAIAETPESLASAAGVTADDFMRGFANIAKSYPLPRTIFLLARFDQMDEMKKILDTVKFNALWLSDNPPRIIPLLTSHMTGLVRQMTTNPPDLPLLLMALYYRYLEKT
ncbi:MAG: hypothetical protein WC030_02120 [Candidatus Paceibacterota bacterium]